jgi:hypothetical protein
MFTTVLRRQEREQKIASGWEDGGVFLIESNPGRTAERQCQSSDHSNLLWYYFHMFKMVVMPPTAPAYLRK